MIVTGLQQVMRGMLVGGEWVAYWELVNLIIRPLNRGVWVGWLVDVGGPLVLVAGDWIVFRSAITPAVWVMAWMVGYALVADPWPRRLMTGAILGFWLLTHQTLPRGDLLAELGVGLATAGLLWAIEFLPRSLPVRAGFATLALLAMMAVLIESALVPWENVSFVVAIGAVLGPYLYFERRRASRWEELKRQADTDHLTGAGTRYAFRRFLDQHALDQGVLLVADLDNFKVVNDAWGHHVGDAVLQEVAYRLKAFLRASDCLVRWGGDEFVVVMPLMPESQAHGVVQRLHAAVTATPVLHAALTLPVELSMGWAWGRLGDATLLSRADQRLLQAKRLGKNRVVGEDMVEEHWEISAAHRLRLDPFVSLLDASYALWAVADARGTIVAANAGFRARYPDLHDTIWNAARDGWQPWKDPQGAWQFVRVLPLGGDWRGYFLTVIGSDRGPRAPWHWPGTIDLVWQPVVAPQTRALLGHEVFARPRLGNEVISPERYFRWAEWVGAEAAADRLCLERVAEVFEKVSVPKQAPYLFINVHPATLLKPQGLAGVVERLNAADRRWRVVVEVTEHGTQALTPDHWDRLDELVPGVEWAQDDFGVGEQDLWRLLRWRPKWVKLDRALVEAASRHDRAHLGRWFIPWAHSMGLRVIAEGVENAQEAQWCADAGCDGVQGWFVGKPEPVTDEAMSTSVLW
ncbi:MAG: bifunctional diguanylate cyclase/phosphodiesterase [Firmicutes bacterium]|nr:bifunctional diguanylate cyclase/phosphodiesterase [Bacillota bacterium]